MRQIKIAVRLMLLAIAISACMNIALGQEETAATITGRVLDSTGAVIPNATVVMTDKATGTERRAQSNDSGSYTVTPLPPGNYTLSVEQPNFKKYLQEVSLSTKDRRLVDVVLEAGSVNEVVTVSSDLVGIQDTPTGQALVNERQVRELPLVNRDFLKLLESGIPGVSSDLADETSLGLTNRTSISINGMPLKRADLLVDRV